MGESDLQAVHSKNTGTCGGNVGVEFSETTTIDLLKSSVRPFLKRGEVHEALNAYISAYSSDFLDSACLEVFIDALAEKARENLRSNVEFNVVYFVCTMCYDVMTEPVTLKCGHTFSKKCVLTPMKSESPFACKHCGKSYSRSYLSQLKTNVTISSLIEKFTSIQRKESQRASTETHRKHSDPGGSLSSSSNFLKKILPSSDSHPIPFQSYSTDEDILVSFENFEEAFKLYLISYTFEPNGNLAKEKAIKLLHDILMEMYSKPCVLDKCQQSLKFKFSYKPREYFSSVCSKSSGNKYSNFSVDKKVSSCESKYKKTSPDDSNLHLVIDSFYREIHQLADGAFDKIETSCFDKCDFECVLCMRLFWEPVTTPCGHTFCRVCLNRWFDHKACCPLCKASLSSFLAERIQSINEFLEHAMQIFIPEDYAERKAINAEEMEELCNAGKDTEPVIPLFVCTIAYPTVPCPLHVFEPRYRHMIRQCMESGSCQFGMCAYVDNNIAEYGTMLQIRDVQYFPDGRSVVDTIGSKRFRILRRGERDGYTTGAVEYLVDEPPEESILEDVKELHNQVYKISQKWFRKLNRTTKHRILEHFGPMPEVEVNYLSSPNGPSWFWWMLAILPIEPRSQLVILSMTSLSQRLETLYRVLFHLDSTIVA